MNLKKLVVSFGMVTALTGASQDVLAQNTRELNREVLEDLDCMGAAYSYIVPSQPNLAKDFKSKLAVSANDVSAHYYNRIKGVLGVKEADRQVQVQKSRFKKFWEDEDGPEVIGDIAKRCVMDRSYPIMEAFPPAIEVLPGMTPTVKDDLFCVGVSTSFDVIEEGRILFEKKHKIAPDKVSMHFMSRVRKSLGEKNGEKAIMAVAQRFVERNTIEEWVQRNFLRADMCMMEYRIQMRTPK